MRKPETERAIFRAIQDAAGFMDASEYWSLVAERLKKGEADYGGSFASRPQEELGQESVEELADVPGWDVLWIQRLAADPEGRSADEIEHFRQIIIQADALVLQAWHMKCMAINFLRETAPVTSLTGRPYEKFFED